MTSAPRPRISHTPDGVWLTPDQMAETAATTMPLPIHGVVVPPESTPAQETAAQLAPDSLEWYDAAAKHYVDRAVESGEAVGGGELPLDEIDIHLAFKGAMGGMSQEKKLAAFAKDGIFEVCTVEPWVDPHNPQKMSEIRYSACGPVDVKKQGYQHMSASFLYPAAEVPEVLQALHEKPLILRHMAMQKTAETTERMPDLRPNYNLWDQEPRNMAFRRGSERPEDLTPQDFVPISSGQTSEVAETEPKRGSSEWYEAKANEYLALAVDSMAESGDRGTREYFNPATPPEQLPEPRLAGYIREHHTFAMNDIYEVCTVQKTRNDAGENLVSVRHEAVGPKWRRDQERFESHVTGFTYPKEVGDQLLADAYEYPLLLRHMAIRYQRERSGHDADDPRMAVWQPDYDIWDKEQRVMAFRVGDEQLDDLAPQDLVPIPVAA